MIVSILCLRRYSANPRDKGVREGGRGGVSVQHLLRHASPLVYTVTEGDRIVKCEPQTQSAEVLTHQ